MQTFATSEKSKSVSAVTVPKNKQQYFFAPVNVLPKLTIGAVDDPYEREADAMADRVMRMPIQQINTGVKTANPAFFAAAPLPVSPVQRECATCIEEEKLNRKQNNQEEETEQIHLKEKSFDGGLNHLDNTVYRKCFECEEEEKVQKKATDNGNEIMSEPYIVHNVINSVGQPLDTDTRNFMESGFGYDFGNVRIHNDFAAHNSSKGINALAYTHKNHIVFGGGQYQPDTNQGKLLLAHELAHVVQQGNANSEAAIQRQPDNLRIHSGVFNLSLLKNVPHEKWDEQIEREYRKRGDDVRANAVRNCRVQGGDACVNMLTIEEVEKLFAVVNAKKGNEDAILLSLTTFLPGGLAVRALAHELAAFVLELVAFAKFQVALKNKGYIILENALGLCIGGCHLQDKSGKSLDILDCTPSEADLAKGANEEYELKGNAKFQPQGALDTYIRYTLSNAPAVPVKVRFGNLGKGIINITGLPGQPVNNPFHPQGDLMMPQDNRFSCFVSDNNKYSYFAVLQTISFTHAAFDNNKPGSVPVMGIEVNANTITGKLGSVDNVKPSNTAAITNVTAVRYDENALLSSIYGEEYTGKNDVVQYFRNDIENGELTYVSWAEITLANQQKINGIFSLTDDKQYWNSVISGNVKGLDPFEFPITRTPRAVLFGDSAALQLDEQWTVGKKTLDGGKFTASGSLRASYKSGNFEFFGSATYASERVHGGVNIAVTNEAEAQKLFLEHELAQVSKGAGGKVPTIFSEAGSTEALALTAWGDLSFTLIDKKDEATAAAVPGAAKPGLEGVGAFVVSPDGYIILSGKLKMPAKWYFTLCFDYDKNFLKDKIIWAMEAPVPGGTVNIKIKLSFDVHAHLNPLELYQIDISGVYSNHPDYRSEVDITPHFYISGCADARLALSVVAAYKALGLFTVVSADGTITGIAEANAYIDAAPVIRKIWNKDMPAVYAIAGTIHTGGKLTFSLTGDANVTILGEKDEDDDKKKDKESEHYHIGTWTLGSFGVRMQLKEYIIGSGNKPDIDFSKIAFGEKQQNSLGYAISQRRESKTAGTDARSGGFLQTDKGRTGETGVFSENAPVLPDPDAEILDNTVSEDFMMKDQIHQLSITFSGTRGVPKALLQLASGKKEPLTDKLEEEKKVLEAKKLSTQDEEKALVELEQRDLNAISTETAIVKKNATDAAQKASPGQDPVVAGFDRLDDRISNYADKYEIRNLGYVQPVTNAPVVSPPVNPATSVTQQKDPDVPDFDPKQINFIKTGDILSVPYKNSRGRAVVTEITKEFVKFKISSKSRNKETVRRPGDIVQWVLIDTFKEQLSSKEIFVWSELRAYLMANRPPYKKGLVQKVWNAAIQTDGKVRDPNPPYEELKWIKSKSRFDQWHMGHKPGHKYSDLVDQLVNEEISWDQFLDEYNTSANYWPELPSKNMGHGFEAETKP